MSAAEFKLADASAAIVALPPPESSRFRAHQTAAITKYLSQRLHRPPELAPHQVQIATLAVRQRREIDEAALREAIAAGEIHAVMRAMRVVGGGVAVWHDKAADRYECRWVRRYGRYTGSAVGDPWPAVVAAAERGLAEEPKGGQG